MDSQQPEYCVMDCGEEKLDESQEKFYSSKLKGFDELLQLARNSQAGPENAWDNVSAVRAPASASSKAPASTWLSLEQCLAQPVPATSTPSNSPFPIFLPSILNQLASSNGYIVTSSTGSGVTAGVPVSAGSGHSLPPLVPSVRLKGPRRTAKSSASPGTITLSSILNTDTQSSGSSRNGPILRYPAPPPPQPLVQHIPAAPSPAAPVSQARVMAPVNQSAPSSAAQIRFRPPSSLTSASSSQHLRVLAPASINNGSSHITGPRVRLPIPPKVVGSSLPKNLTPRNSTPMLQEMRNAFTDPACELPVPSQNSAYNKRTVPPPNVPLLPETRPETASDSRPRPRPGPASRTRPIPPANDTSSSECMQTSDMVDLTQDDQPLPNTKKAPVKEKTFPSLIVTARASLKIFSSALVNNDRLLMDNQIRKVMQMTPSVFTEYLLQQRLLKAEQFCEVHNKPLKLGIYSDPNRFPVSGGYVWIADCCKSGFCSVYSGSLFDKTLQPPTNIIKLMYHWACNTAVHNVLNWVKVDSYIIKTYNTFFRAVCTAMIHQKFALLGGSFKKIQVGVISVGTYPDGATKEVKVDIMAVMDPDIPQIRLKVLENFLSDSNKVYESKFRKILEVLKEWVHPQSTIITDFAVDMHLCREYGFSNLVVSGGRHSANNNNGVMDYMRAKIPVMFQNTLGLLSYTIIQQFLDELVWRETWGPFPSRAYETLVKHIAELTKLRGPDLIVKLKRIASEPTKNWKFSVWNEQSPPESDKGVEGGVSLQEALTQPLPKSSDKVNKEKDHPRANVNNESPAVRPQSSISPAVQVPMEPGNRLKDADRKIFLEAYYYGLVEGNPALQKRTGAFLAECVLCKRDFLSASSFTNHLIQHALNNNATMSKVSSDQLLTVCPICCKIVNDLECHKKVTHPSKPGFMCKICRLDLKTEEKLVKHMCFVHQELDMPYKCDVCHFQTSIFDSAVNHFKDFHDKDSFVRCPYCLKTVRFSSKSGLDITANQYYFVQHVQKHSVSKLNRKCEKCVLSFNNMGTLKQHQEKVHIRSGRLLKNVRRIKSDPAKMLMMPFPNQAPLPPVTLHENSFHTLKGKALSSSVKVPEYYSVCSCLECDGPMTQNHFSVKMTCTKCSFQSCCPNAIREHSARHHHVADGSTLVLRSQILGGSASLDRTLYCSYCTYSSTNGNKMADHMVNCGDGGAVATADKRKLGSFVSPLKIKYEIH